MRPRPIPTAGRRRPRASTSRPTGRGGHLWLPRLGRHARVAGRPCGRRDRASSPASPPLLFVESWSARGAWLTTADRARRRRWKALRMGSLRVRWERRAAAGTRRFLVSSGGRRAAALAQPDGRGSPRAARRAEASTSSPSAAPRFAGRGLGARDGAWRRDARPRAPRFTRPTPATAPLRRPPVALGERSSHRDDCFHAASSGLATDEADRVLATSCRRLSAGGVRRSRSCAWELSSSPLPRCRLWRRAGSGYSALRDGSAGQRGRGGGGVYLLDRRRGEYVCRRSAQRARRPARMPSRSGPHRWRGPPCAVGFRCRRRGRGLYFPSGLCGERRHRAGTVLVLANPARLRLIHDPIRRDLLYFSGHEADRERVREAICRSTAPPGDPPVGSSLPCESESAPAGTSFTHVTAATVLFFLRLDGRTV